ncbi:hypothetical protein [Pseudogemmobacter bohemicus]|nr:hypothetical protein [Pseudogemmobacter bohemicus]
MFYRRTGAPVTVVEEPPVPQEVAFGDYVAPTRPSSSGMPLSAQRP